MAEVTLSRIQAASGEVRRYASEQTWSQIRDGAGTSVVQTTYINPAYMDLYPYDPDPLWIRMARGVMCFDTSSISSDEVITDGIIRIRITGKAAKAGVTMDICVVSASPASPGVDLIAADYGTLGVTLLSNVLAYGSIITGDWNNLTLTQAGRDAINKGAGAKTCFGLRNYTHDALDSEPSQGETNSSSIAINNDSPYDCKLVLTYAAEDSVVYPSEAITRVTSITHRYDRGVYNMVVGLGDVISDADIPSVDTTVRRSYTPKELIEAMMFPEVGMYKCPICGMIFPSLTLLFHHLTVTHGIGKLGGCTEGDYKVDEYGNTWRCEGGQWVRGM